MNAIRITFETIVKLDTSITIVPPLSVALSFETIVKLDTSITFMREINAFS